MHASECLTTLSLTVFKETLQQTFFKRSALFDGKRPFYSLSPLWGLMEQRMLFIWGPLESS